MLTTYSGGSCPESERGGGGGVNVKIVHFLPCIAIDIMIKIAYLAALPGCPLDMSLAIRTYNYIVHVFGSF